MNNFYVDESQVQDGRVRISGADVNHIKNVLRMKAGEEIMVRDGRSGNYRCRITRTSDDAVEADILEKLSTSELPVRMKLYQCLPKTGKLELVIQKAVELGAVSVTPVMSRHCVAKMKEDRAENRLKRLNAVAKSAAEQCGRDFIPEILPVMSFEKAVRQAAEADMALIPYELEDGVTSFSQALGKLETGMTVCVFIGPEGGFAREEVELAKEHGIIPVSLGRRILRTETAAITALSVIMFAAEELAERDNAQTGQAGK